MTKKKIIWSLGWKVKNRSLIEVWIIVVAASAVFESWSGESSGLKGYNLFIKAPQNSDLIGINLLGNQL